MLHARPRVSLFPETAAQLLEPPDFLDVQKASYKLLLDEGLSEELTAFFPVKSYDGKLELSYAGRLKLGEPKLTPEECLVREVTYSVPLKVRVRLSSKETGEVKEQDVFMGDIPMMTRRGTFIINGAERVVVSQLVRSPGVYFRQSKKLDKLGNETYFATIIPDRGSWLEIEMDASKVIHARINKTRRLPIVLFLSAIGCTEKEIEHAFYDPEFCKKNTEEIQLLPKEEALIEMHKKLRPGDPLTIEGAQLYLHNLFFSERRYDLGRVGRYKLNNKLGISVDQAVQVLTKEDILAITSYLIKLYFREGLTDDIDHLGNRRIRSVGELLQRQFRVGLARVERLMREQMIIKAQEDVSPQNLINIRPLVAVLREFFGSSQLSQFMDQTNPLSELTHKRRLSALGPGGLSRERAGFEVRDIHPSHYGRICPIETPEGPNAGLIASLGTYARVNRFGFVETPYRKVAKGVITDQLDYLTADMEDFHKIAPCDIQVEKGGRIKDELIPVRYRREFVFANGKEVDYVGVAPAQVVGVTTALIPFLEHDDANRALMGANMQRQAVPLLETESPYVGTGLEEKVAIDSGAVITAENAGKVIKASATEIVIQTRDGKKDKYSLQKYLRTNQNTCLDYRPIVTHDQSVKRGQPIADGSATSHGELSLGRNVLVAFTPWEGYNFEDAILISDRLVKLDVYSSVHIERHEVERRATKLGMEEITRELPNVGEEALKDLDEDGVIRVGAEVRPGDILVGKITPKGETELPAEEKLLRAIFGDKARDMKDTSLRVPPGDGGKVIGIRRFSREQGDDLPPGVHEIVRVYMAQFRKVSVGDKMAGRHGNKGVIAKILPEEDLPYLPDGTPVDVVLNPLGVPSRMNVGQIFELVLGLASHYLGTNFSVPLFDESLEENASQRKLHELLRAAREKSGISWISPSGKVMLRDGRTGEYFSNPVAVGYMYLMKLHHLVDDKMHARSTGPYSLITQQPLGGKAQFGGQRFGEMEVWALEAYGAAYTLQELLTIKSDDVTGRAKVYESIIKGKTMSKPGIPESFKVLMKELRSLALNVRVMTTDGMETDIDAESRPKGKIGLITKPNEKRKLLTRREKVGG